MPAVSTVDNVLPLLLLWSLPSVSTAINNMLLLLLLLWSLPSVRTAINNMLLLWRRHAICTTRSGVLRAAVVLSTKRSLLRQYTRGLLLVYAVEGGEVGEPLLLLLPGRGLPERHDRRRGPGPARE